MEAESVGTVLLSRSASSLGLRDLGWEGLPEAAFPAFWGY